MSLFRMRQLSRVVALALLLATARGLPHIAQDDDACVSEALASITQHDESRHAFRAGRTVEREHCAVCHWTRSLRTLRAAVAVVAAQVVHPQLIVESTGRLHLPPVSENLPARAPPTALL